MIKPFLKSKICINQWAISTTLVAYQLSLLNNDNAFFKITKLFLPFKPSYLNIKENDSRRTKYVTLS